MIAAQQDSSAAPARIVVVTGMSGAGKTAALKGLEDLGYEAVDNVPLALVAELVDPERDSGRPLAIGIDIRTRDFTVAGVNARLDALVARRGAPVRLVFLDCGDEILRRRYSETRHRHPLAEEGRLTEAIGRERELLAPLRERADEAIDTSTLTLAGLKRRLAGACGLGDAPAPAIALVSFAYRNGLPPEADIVFDVRFLANPHYQPDLASLTGLDGAVAAFVEADPAFAPFFESLTAFLAVVLPRYRAEGKSYLTIAIGCTGGRHRSVFVVDRLAARLAGEGHTAAATHRDLASEAAA
ncbi:MAG: RNase adapter RapZ [Defluviicoccus sp.]|nr:RNase adapter RapZ [Defluviicoccus sp.]